MKRKRIVLVLLIVLIVFLGFWFGKGIFKKDLKPQDEIKVIKEIKDYNYQLTDNKTPLFADLFKELISVLKKEEKDNEEYAVLVSKLFVADFFDLKSKFSKDDIGGGQFVHSSLKDNFLLQAGETFYKYVQNNFYGDRKQELPEVKKIEVSKVEVIEYTYNDYLEENAYQVNLNWEYTKELGYQTTARVILVPEGKKISIAEFE
ncbi:MAG: hypothetical protein ACOXZR_00555 [Bacilli bacterium]|jgi:hypothetical protein